jgi:hypothetical protein
MIELKIASEIDIAGVLALQEKYLYANTPAHERSGGFVTTPFTTAQLQEVIDLQRLFVANHNGTVVGYAFAGSWEYFSQWPIFPFMAERLPQLNLNTMAINTSNSFQYGPICIDESQRGTGIFQELFHFMKNTMQPFYPIGVTFINKINERSYKAHTTKLNMVVIDEFSFNSNNYYGLAFETNL